MNAVAACGSPWDGPHRLKRKQAEPMKTTRPGGSNETPDRVNKAPSTMPMQRYARAVLSRAMMAKRSDSSASATSCTRAAESTPPRPSGRSRVAQLSASMVTR